MDKSLHHLSQVLQLLEFSGHHRGSPVLTEAWDYVNSLKQVEVDKTSILCDNGSPGVSTTLLTVNAKEDIYFPPDIGCSMIGVGD